MEPIKVVAILKMSAGNESVGEMWNETKIFDENATLYQVMRWAYDTKNRYSTEPVCIEKFKGDLTITIAQ